MQASVMGTICFWSAVTVCVVGKAQYVQKTTFLFSYTAAEN